MFRLELDLRIYFLPLMDQHSRGFTLTRTIQLPFAPNGEISIAGRQLDECPEPMGFKLFDVIWDVDREVFLAHTFMLNQDVPLAMIPDFIGSWISLGWRLGSYLDAYPNPDDPEPNSSGETRKEETDFAFSDCEEMEQWPTMQPSKRPQSVNNLLKAIVRMMVELDNNTSIAYAIFKTKRYFTEEEQKNLDPTAVRKFKRAEADYVNMPFEKQLAWRKRIQRTFPKLASFVPDI